MASAVAMSINFLRTVIWVTYILKAPCGLGGVVE